MDDVQGKPRQRAPGAGRKPIDPSGENLVAVNTRMTVAQREKFKELGGSGWLRRKIDEAPTSPRSKS
ncbi:hypothetical protein [Paracidovorax avenae]|uniref:hypothetical protein n=1 Tax=Paracidovorax avenae TaxID=80867 RepID=UPI001313EA19|nr:hypothetical protein [Paracidovorax avenae]